MGRGMNRAVTERALENALGGSNLSNWATDNSSQGLAAREAATGKFIEQSESVAGARPGAPGNETFFSPGWAEPD